MAPIARYVLVEGLVQGVGFRWYAKERARRLGLTGWIQNLPDGRVEAWIEGDEAAVDAMLTGLREGPPSARVERCDARPVEPPDGHERFGERR